MIVNCVGSIQSASCCREAGAWTVLSKCSSTTEDGGDIWRAEDFIERGNATIIAFYRRMLTGLSSPQDRIDPRWEWDSLKRSIADRATATTTKSCTTA